MQPAGDRNRLYQPRCTEVAASREVLLDNEDLTKVTTALWVNTGCVADCNLELQPPESRSNVRDILISLLRNRARYEINASLFWLRSIFACSGNSRSTSPTGYG